MSADQLRVLAYEATRAVNEIALLEDVSQREVERVFQSLSRHLIARSRDARRNADIDEAQALANRSGMKIIDEATDWADPVVMTLGHIELRQSVVDALTPRGNEDLL